VSSWAREGSRLPETSLPGAEILRSSG
jgi:hypothetical protein